MKLTFHGDAVLESASSCFLRCVRQTRVLFLVVLEIFVEYQSKSGCKMVKPCQELHQAPPAAADKKQTRSLNYW